MALDLLKLFVAVAEERNFRAAADRLGLTRSAVSQGVRRLEDNCGTALFQRTTRSVRLTEIGQVLFEKVSGPLMEVQSALTGIAEEAGPRGHLKIAVTSIAERFLSGPLIASFAVSYPDVTIDITVTDDEFDIVAAGFDAGVRLGEVIEQDMIAVAVTGEQREVVVAAPAYLEKNSVPQHPSELVKHTCIGWRPNPNVAPYRWEFEQDGQAFSVSVNPQITTNDLLLMIRTAVAGAGFTFAPEETFRPYIERGELVPVLTEYLPSFPGFYLYYPNRANLPPKLRALVDHVMSWKRRQ